ncbi:uncharacterized protein LOC106175481 [Lingula anatina]|uniref:Uncharacterized protein LOC106175481 n=1 Tax=Lingula anatina TaxID=7574 RepID=A0A1S3JS82_LINAN|nr:uncharacterized protein LOC106175481 [Lingula anatina]|eukprot:XP_013412966.1 uncharacterized protein LOC106175481 [Lingula anatina]
MARLLLLNYQVRLQRKWYELCDGLAGGFALSLGQLLVQKGVLTVQEKDQINPEWTRLQQNEKLLKFILYSDDETYERFLQVLEGHLPWMADELHEDVPGEELQRHQDAVKRTCTLPSKLSHFTDREEERRQITTWLTDSRNTRTVIVQGHGGLGKTAIAIQVGYELLQSYGVRVVRARLQNVKTTFDILYSVLSSFNDVTLDLAEIGSRNSILEGILRNLLQRRAFLYHARNSEILYKEKTNGPGDGEY